MQQETAGNRKGWRLPTIQDLSSLMDPSAASPGPMLAAGHPFIAVHSQCMVGDECRRQYDAWRAHFGSGAITITGIANPEFFWCVRGGHGPDCSVTREALMSRRFFASSVTTLRRR